MRKMCSCHHGSVHDGPMGESPGSGAECVAMLLNQSASLCTSQSGRQAGRQAGKGGGLLPRRMQEMQEGGGLLGRMLLFKAGSRRHCRQLIVHCRPLMLIVRADIERQPV